MSHLSEGQFASLGRFVKPHSQYGNYKGRQLIAIIIMRTIERITRILLIKN